MKLSKAVFVTTFPALGTVPNHVQVATLPPTYQMPLLSCSPSTTTTTTLPQQLRGNQVLIANKASVLTRDDAFIAQRSFAGGFSFLQVDKEPTKAQPHILGGEFAGIVEAIGPDVQRMQVGDCVCGYNDGPNRKQMGTWTEQVLTVESQAVKFDPAQLTTFIQAAAVVLPAALALTMLRDAGIEVVNKPEEEAIPQKNKSDHKKLRCLVIGAAGMVGSALTKLLCNSACPDVAFVAGVCGTRNVDKVKALGADDVYDYKKGTSIREQLKESGKPQYDVVFDVVGGMNTQEEAMRFLLKPTSESVFVTAVGPFPNIGSRVLSPIEQTWFGWHLFVWKPLHNKLQKGKPRYMFSDIESFSSDQLEAALEAGFLPEVERVVPMDQQAVRKALEYVLSSTPKNGRTALAVSPDASEPILDRAAASATTTA